MKLADTKVAASTSFPEREVLALAVVLKAVREGRDTSAMRRSKDLLNVERKVQGMTATCLRQRQRRAEEP